MLAAKFPRALTHSLRKSRTATREVIEITTKSARQVDDRRRLLETTEFTKSALAGWHMVEPKLAQPPPLEDFLQFVARKIEFRYQPVVVRGDTANWFARVITCSFKREHSEQRVRFRVDQLTNTNVWTNFRNCAAELRPEERATESLVRITQPTPCAEMTLRHRVDRACARAKSERARMYGIGADHVRW